MRTRQKKAEAITKAIARERRKEDRTRNEETSRRTNNETGEWCKESRRPNMMKAESMRHIEQRADWSDREQAREEANGEKWSDINPSNMSHEEWEEKSQKTDSKRAEQADAEWCWELLTEERRRTMEH